MSLSGIQAAYQIGLDRRAAVRFGRQRWRRVHMAVGDRWWVCPFCGVPVASKSAKVLHELYEARIVTLMTWAGILGTDELAAADEE